MTSKMINGMPAKVLGKMEAERPCDLCGNTTLKTAVVVECGGAQIQIGRHCAAKAIYGSKSAGNACKIDSDVFFAEKERLHRQYLEENKISRICSIHDKRYCGGVANWSYKKTGRKVVGSFFATLGDLIVRVDGKDMQDVLFYQKLGFVQSTAVVV